MTPCEKRGYKIGDRFRVIGNDNDPFAVGSVIELWRDDGSSCPKFKLIEGFCNYRNCGGEPGAYKELSTVEKIMTNSIQDRIRKAREELEAAEREYAEQQRKDEKWEPKGGPWSMTVGARAAVRSRGSVESCRLIGAERESEELTEKAARARIIHDRMLNYVHEHAPDYEYDANDAWTVEKDGVGGWEIVDASCLPIGAVIGPKQVMQQLADDLMSGRVTLLPEGYE